MKCPVDNCQLVMSERSGIEIDYCPECRGVWLDRGELDKILERSAPSQQSHTQNTPSSYNSSDHNMPPHTQHHKKREKESFLGDLFDF